MTSQSQAQTTSSTNARTGQAYYLFAISLLLVVFLGTVIQYRSVLLGLGFTELVLILLPAILFVRWKKLPIAEALRWKPIPPSTALLSFAVGITCWGVAAGMFVLSQSILGEPPAVEALAPTTLRDLIWVLFFAALLPGLCEETLFRGAIQGVLGRNGRKRSVVITALLFAVFHVNPWILVPGFFLGIVFGILVVRTGSTIPAILAHIANNATAFTVTYFYHDQPESNAYMLMGGLAIAALIVIPIFCFLTRGHDVDPPLLSTVPAGIERVSAWLIGLTGFSVLAGFLALVLAGFFLVGMHTVADEGLEPEYHRGDQLIMFKSGMVELDLEAGDVVSLQRDGGMILRKIVRLDEDNVWIHEDRIETRVSRKDITGKVVHVIKAEN